MMSTDGIVTTDRVRRCLDRAMGLTDRLFERRRVYWVEALARWGHLPAVLREAHCLAHTLASVPILIDADELIVGRREIEPAPSEATEAYQHHRRTIAETTQGAVVPDAVTRAREAGWFTAGIKTGHMVPHYAAVLSGGLAALADRNLHAADQLDPTQGDYYDRAMFHQAVGIVLDAGLRFAMRHAAHATELARTCDDPVRQAELDQIAAVCRHCLHRGARTFREALQAVWLVHLMVCIECGESHASFGHGRLDQYLWPFYEADREAERLDHQHAAELVHCFWIKIVEMGQLPMNLTVGGTRPAGGDATNDLTWLCLDATERLRTLNPSLTLRWHDTTPRDLKRRAVRVLRTGLGMPQLYSDRLARRTMSEAGVIEEDTYQVVPCGCVELSIEGKSNPWVGSFFNLVKCLELALHNGIDPVLGRRLGKATGEAADLKSFDAVWQAYLRQMRCGLRLMVASENLSERLQAVCWPSPFLSALVDDCLERHRDYWDGGARYNFNEIQGVGIANVVDSLAAIRHVVFDRKELALTELVRLLDEDFRSGVDWPRRLMRDAPKYGNQVDWVDALAVRLIDAFSRECMRHRNSRGGPFVPGLLVWTLARDFGRQTGATPDGRRSGQVLADSIGPAQGRDRLGPTATVQSVCAPDYSRIAGGLSFNMKFDAGTLGSDAAVEKFIDLVDTYFKLGGLQVQVNVTDADALRRAQAEPESYRDLIVRVSGWSARFVGLSPEHQNEIIRRTSHAL